MTAPVRSANPAEPLTRPDDSPQRVRSVGSLDAFWPLMEPILAGLGPRRWCEIGVDEGLFTGRLLTWGREHGCAYIGIDPAPGPSAADLIRTEQNPPGRLIIGRSLDVLPGLEPCEVYFIDGDHNYHTVRHELTLIARAGAGAGPVIFVHDVGWPFARRDMYHEPGAIPPEARRPYSVDLAVSLESDALGADGLRSPGRYAIAQSAGGEHNGVLTAVEDFLEGNAGLGWKSVMIPAAYGLAILYRPASVPAPCRVALDELASACLTMTPLLKSCEANYLTLYLYAEAVKSRLAYWTGDGQPGRAAYEQSQAAYEKLDGAYRELSAHSEALMQEYHRLLEAYHALARSVRRGPEA